VVPLDEEAGIIDEGPPHEKSAAAPEADEEASAPAAGQDAAGAAAGQDAAGAAPAGPEAEASTTGAVTACFCQLPRDNGLRSACIAIYESPNFDRTTLTLIFLNCITLALYDPLDPDCKTSRCEAVAPIDKFLGVYFTCEMIVKMFALGVFRFPDPEMAEEIYFDSAWNRFDCFIVVTSWIDWIPGLEGGSFSALRAFRALRPLRAVNKFPKLKILVKLLLDTIPMLASVGLLCFIIFFVYGILATQFWMGLMHQRCFNPAVNRTHANYLVGGDGSGGEGYWVPEDGDYICAMGPGAYSTGLASCSAKNGVPAQFSDCRKDGPIPFQGAIAYDNILQSWLVLFQIITLEGWVDQMYVIQGAFNFTTGWVFFCSLVVIGAFFAVNLALVVISSQFSNTKGGEMDALEAEEAAQKKAAREAYDARKAAGITPTMWELISTGEICNEPEEVINEKLAARIEKLKQLGDAEQDAEAHAVISKDIQRCEIKEIFPISEAEAKAEGGMTWSRWRMRWVTVIDDRFGNFIMATIVTNVTLMATEHYNQPDSLTDFLKFANYVFAGIFIVEMLCKWFALGFSEYFSDNFNTFDCIIVFISILEIIMGGGGLSVLRMLRLVRVFRLIKFLPMLQRQIIIIGETLVSVLSFLLLLGLFIFIFAVVGMFLFGGKFQWTEEDSHGTYLYSSRKNFNNIIWALITIFQTLTFEDWNAGLYDAVKGTGTQWCAMYYVILTLFGNYIMFNLFVAILIDGFASEEDEFEDLGEDPADIVEEEVDTLLGVRVRRVSRIDAEAIMKRRASMQETIPEESPKPKPSSEGSGVGSGYGHPTMGSSQPAFGQGSGTAGADAASGVAELDPVPSDTPSANGGAPEATGEAVTTPADDSDAAGAKYIPSDDLPSDPNKDIESGALAPVDAGADGEDCYARDNSCFVFSPENPVRVWCNGIWPQPWFDNSIMFVILVNSICMAMERPEIKDGSTERNVLDGLGYAFNLIFSVEMIIKWIGMGVYWNDNNPEGPYWRSAWNRLDGTIVLISWLDVVLTLAQVTGGALELLKLCRMLRALRPLRAVSRIPGLKKIVNVLVASLAPIGTTMIIVMAFFFLFGILGGQIFAGTFFYCNEADRLLQAQIFTKADCIRLATDGENAWQNQAYNFDHLGNSLMTLFVLSSIDGWVEIMYNGIDSVGVDMNPKENHREGLAFFFVAFLLIGGFFIINMFVGVIVENFQKHGAEAIEESVPDAPLPEVDEFQERENYSEGRRWWVTHVTSPLFENAIAATIVVCVIVMGSEHYNTKYANYTNEYDGMSSEFKMFLRISNYIFTVIFIYEMVAKYYAFGCERFHMGSYPLSSWGWNNFDAFIVWISILGIVFDDFIGADNLPIDPSLLRILRILRVARVLKLVKSAKDLMTLLTTVSRSLAQVGNLGTLLFLLFFIYSCLGIELFGRIDCTVNNGCDGFSEYANFKNVGMAMLVLFRLSTGDNWNGMMKDALRGEPPLSNSTANMALYNNTYGCSFAVSCAEPLNCCAGCDITEECVENCCGNQIMTPLYYISFCVLSTFVMLNLVVATLMGELEKAGLEDVLNEEKERQAKRLSKDKEEPTTAEDETSLVTEFSKDAIESSDSLVPQEDGEKPPAKLEPLPPGATSPIGVAKPIRPSSPTHFVPFAPGVTDDTESAAPADGATGPVN